ILKVNYIPLYLRILPAMIYQTIIFIIFLTLYSAVTGLFVDDWLLNIYTFIYYISLGLILTIPFTMLFLGVSMRLNTNKINILLFAIVLIVAQKIAEFLPLYHYTELYRVPNTSWSEVIPSIIILLLYTVAFMIIGIIFNNQRKSKQS